MIVWGGSDGAGPRADGGAYDPRLDRKVARVFYIVLL